jgi:hypothetical protein
VRSDFWSGELYRDLKLRGLFQEKTDIALSLSSDGVKVFKTRSAFQIWPIMLVCTTLLQYVLATLQMESPGSRAAAMLFIVTKLTRASEHLR